MKILVTGNCGYIGPVVGKHLRDSLDQAELYGFDNGYFLDFALESTPRSNPWRQQYYGDIRDLDLRLLEGIDTVVHLAAISNDPMGNRYGAVTEAINEHASIRLAHAAKELGVKRFVFASSCSIYGSASDGPRTEEAQVNPLTAYARSKVAMEEALLKMSSDSFSSVCLRFSTACGRSPRLRLDLVLNDFVATALAESKIHILSDGRPWRPLIDVADMARAIEWACIAELPDSNNLSINVGSNDRNYQVTEIAQAVSDVLGGVTIEINRNAAPDKRSYQVDFSRFARLAPLHQPRISLKESIQQVAESLKGYSPVELRELKKRLTRLNVLEQLRSSGALDEQLTWIEATPCTATTQR